MEGIDTIPNTDADNALILGTALHTGIEEGVEQALDFYKNSFPVLTDDHIHEMMKLEAMIPKAKAMLPPGGTFELPIGNADFIGFMDYLVPVGKGLKLDGLITGEDLDEFEAFDLYDFKYSNNAKNYAVSGQLHEYKYWYELTHPGHRIRNMYFLIVPKPKIRQKSTETLSQFRDRLQAALKDAEPTLMPVQYNPMKIVDFLTDVKHMVEATDFPKNPNHFCGWCEYEEYCQKGWDYMLLPKNERRDLNATKKKVVWLYGAPFSGKTFFANQFPDPLMLNTDGNIKFVDAPYIAIRDTVTVEGRITKRKLAYEVFMDAVAELEKKQNDFRTIVVDLLEDVYESCRVYICDRQGWKHESDDSFRAWDMVRSEFLNTLKRLVNLDYCMYRRNELGKAFILIGDKSNGKSTFLHVVKNLLGDQNIASLDLKELGDRFKTAELFGKLANIGDDIGDEFIANASVFKKLVTGDRVNVERKGQDPFEFNNYSKFLFSANNIPRIKDKTGAVQRRLVIVPFDAKFTPNDADFRPFIKDELCEQGSMEYLALLGLQGLKRVLGNAQFTTSSRVQGQLDEYEENNNPIIGFINEVGLDGIENEATDSVYRRYKEYCIANNFQALSKIEFSRQITKRCGFTTVPKWIRNRKTRVFVKGGDTE